jgi:propanol-preferring alcohol dehydrogenase
MRVAVLPTSGPEFHIEERPDPQPAPGEVVVDVLACGAGVTLTNLIAHWDRNTPRVFGHEFGGRISAIGAGVHGWSIGDRVTATFYLVCGQCDLCADGLESHCRNFAGLIGVHRDGAFAERVVVPARNLVRVPDAVDLAVSGIVSDAIGTPYHVVRRRLALVAGERVVVLGAGGGLGVHTLEIVRAFGGVAIAVEKDPDKLKALRAGNHAEVIVDAADSDWPKKIKSTGVDAAIDTVGHNETLAAAAACLSDRGRMVIIGVSAGASLTLTSTAMIMGELSIMGTRYCTRGEIAASLDLVAAGRIRTVVGARFPLEAINEAYAAIRNNRVFGRVLIDMGGA